MKNLKTLFLTFGMPFLFFCCKEEEQVKLNSLTLSFSHVVDGKPLELDTIKYINEAGNKYSVQTLKYYISDISLKAEDGKEFKIDTILYCDVLMPKTLEHQLINIPSGKYKTISFTFGLDSTKNKSYSISNTPENRAMEWPDPMGGGYHYMKFEGTLLVEKDSFAHFNTHTGRVKDMKGNLFNNDFKISLNFSPIDLSKQEVNLEVKMDLNEWYKSPFTYDLTSHLKIMDNQEAQTMLKANAKDAFTIGNNPVR